MMEVELVVCPAGQEGGAALQADLGDRSGFSDIMFLVTADILRPAVTNSRRRAFRLQCILGVQEVHSRASGVA